MATSPVRCARAIALPALLVAAGCAPVQLVSRYDPQTDQAAMTIQRDVSTFFVGLDADLLPEERSFGRNQDFYQRQAVAVAGLSLRARAIPDNALTVEQVDLLRENLAWLALLHKGCVHGPLSDAQKAAVRQNGIDVSIACRTAYGADADLSDRSSQTLNPLVAAAAHELIDTGLVAILRLELAKKRGADQ